MKSSKTLYTEAFKEYELPKQELQKLQEVLLGMLKDFAKICEENHINYSLGAGSLLGAIRHKGFIPWDDDVDILMTRDNFKKLEKIYQKETGYSKKYKLVIPGKTNGYIGKTIKIYKYGTELVEIPSMNFPIPKMIYIDIFLIENIPNTSIGTNLNALVHDFCAKATSLCLDYKYPSKIILQKSKNNKELKKYYNTRRLFGFIFSHIGGYNLYLKIMLKKQDYKKASNRLGVPSAISYKKGIFDKNTYEETIDWDFCDTKVKVLKDYNKYLSYFYGKNYMSIPPKNKRETHVSYSHKF